MVANIEGLAGFTKRNRRSCEMFYARREKTLVPRFCQVNTRRSHMANATGNICSGPKRPRPSDSSDPEPNPVYSSPSSLDSTIETVLRKAVRMRVDAEKAYSSLLGRIKLLEEHAGQGTSPSGLRIKKSPSKGSKRGCASSQI